METVDVDATVNDVSSVGGRERQSATTFVDPEICWISSMYSASRENCRDCRGLLVLFWLRWNELVIGLWSVKTTVWRPSIRCLNFSVAAKIASSSLSNVL